MDQSPVRRRPRLGFVSLVVVLILAGGLVYAVERERNSSDLTANFTLNYPPAAHGWEPLAHGPQTLFLYRQASKGLLIRGAINQMVSNINPTPELDRDNLAQLMIDNTHDNMPGWTAELGDKVDAKGTSFRLVRRSERRHVVVTAFAVKGNTTVLISLSGRDQNATEVDKDMSEFQSFISKMALTKADSSKW